MLPAEMGVNKLEIAPLVHQEAHHRENLVHHNEVNRKHGTYQDKTSQLVCFTKIRKSCAWFVLIACAVSLAVLSFSSFSDNLQQQQPEQALIGHFMRQFGHEKDPACLDGSPPRLYFRAGSSDGKRKYLVHHMGGSWCRSLQDCEKRSHTSLGTSNIPSIPDWAVPSYVSVDKKYAPSWYNWNQVFLVYCDGASFSGDVNGTVLEPKSGKQLYFRGYQNLRAMMRWTLDHGLGGATDLIVIGASAGGMSAYQHTPEWCHVFRSNRLYEGGPLLEGNVQGKKTCVAVIDAGFFPNMDKLSTSEKGVLSKDQLWLLQGGRRREYVRQLEWVYTAQNVTMNNGCQTYFQGRNQTKCMFAEHVAAFVPQPILMLGSKYDSWVLNNLRRSDNVTSGYPVINQIGNVVVNRIQNMALQMNPKSRVWLTSCSEHITAQHWQTAMVDGLRAPDAVEQWYTGLNKTPVNRNWIAEDKFPCTTCC